MAKITIDGKDYDTDSFSDDAKKNFASLQFVQTEINRLQSLLAVAKTAQVAYSTALKNAVES
ncbi:DUF6447 family protein [Prochlorococcus marinus]|uniref:Uncharacterized protein n=1 Tax=Prochlorococcus marinus XMU1408 TaxID=2213228 RepID=A0A318R0J8_PROMR|nr:DUF6447 family protein [Prochlorococcus marinus]MBW3042871.1 hypothetical protein [Prochlorococcus marinus str. XMU1408]PYE00697.1 hypothetical protein DNJ73_09140 [Prochlorococcus marinus XMU1408]